MTKNIDIIGNTAHLTGWATHSVRFAIAMQNYVEVNFRTNKKSALKQLIGKHRRIFLNGLVKPLGDFCIVIIGNTPRYSMTSRWIVWETTVLPKSQIDICATVEWLWTPTNWGRNNLINNGIHADRISVVPEGVATDFFAPATKKNREGRFRFLMVGKWEERKFITGLIKAFTNEFKPNEPVELYLQAHNPYIKGFSLSDKIKELGFGNTHNILLGSPCSNKQLLDLYRSADCFVLPTRAEGWGLPILEAMACGIPPIVTRYSAPLDYVNENNGYLLNVERMVDACDNSFGINIGKWAEPDVKHLSFLMRQAFQNRDELYEKGKKSHTDSQMFSWDMSAKTAIKEIQAKINCLKT